MATLPPTFIPAVHDLLTERPELDGIGITDALMTTAAA